LHFKSFVPDYEQQFFDVPRNNVRWGDAVRRVSKKKTCPFKVVLHKKPLSSYPQSNIATIRTSNHSS
jgi:hypothetical protein